VANEEFPETIGPSITPLPDALEYEIPLKVASVDVTPRGGVVVYVGPLMVSEAGILLYSTD
jgi:hypothetical protein